MAYSYHKASTLMTFCKKLKCSLANLHQLLLPHNLLYFFPLENKYNMVLFIVSIQLINYPNSCNLLQTFNGLLLSGYFGIFMAPCVNVFYYVNFLLYNFMLLQMLMGPVTRTTSKVLLDILSNLAITPLRGALNDRKL